MKEYRKALDKGVIKYAYQGLMDYILSLKSYFLKLYPDFLVSSNLYLGYMDMTYFSIVPPSLKNRKLKIAVVFIHQKFCFEVWLAGVNKKVQGAYWQLFKDSDWNKFHLVPSIQGVDAILQHTLVKDPDFSDLKRLTRQIEDETLAFIVAIEAFFAQSPG
jgi:hypothetical protein